MRAGNFLKCFYLLILLAVCVLCIGCDLSRNMSNFSEFEYRLHLQGYYNDENYELENGTVASVKILRSKGSYRLEMSLYVEGENGADQCLNNEKLYGMDCILSKELTPRNLDPTEVEQVKTAFSEIQTRMEYFPSGMRVEGFCPATEMRWDDFRIMDRQPVLGPDLIVFLKETTVHKIAEVMKQLAVQQDS